MNSYLAPAIEECNSNFDDPSFNLRKRESIPVSASKNVSRRTQLSWFAMEFTADHLLRRINSLLLRVYFSYNNSSDSSFKRPMLCFTDP